MTERPIGVHHFFVNASEVGDGLVEFSGEEAHHASRVLRIRPGETITVADGSGRVVEALVRETGATVRAEVLGEQNVDAPKPGIVLYQAVAKGRRMDDVIEKAVEVGVRRIVPFMAERTIVRWDRSKRDQAPTRWTAIARAAAKQSRSSYLTDVSPVVDGAAAALEEGSTVVVLDETSSLPLREGMPASPADDIVLVVGPEGGFTSGELEQLRSGGASLVTLGPRILRTETAGAVAAAIISYAYGTLG